MRIRTLSFFLIILIGTSCQFFKLKKNEEIHKVDSVIDFSSVDVSPSFRVCDEFIEKEVKTNCFRNTIYTHISSSLGKHNLMAKKAIKEEIIVVVVIDQQGITTVKSIHSSTVLKETIMGIDSLVNLSVAQLPKLSPARKRGIPVVTQYQIPIQIHVK